MRKFFVLFTLLLNSVVFSQNFQIQVTPEKDTIIQGDSINFNITAIPSGGFNASIYLSAISPSCISPHLNISPIVLNSPYNNCQVNISSTSSIISGDYMIVLKGENGAIISYDTCYLNVKNSISQQWVVYNDQNSGMTYNSVWDIAVDSLNSEWLAIYYQAGYGNAPGCLAHYNGTTWEIWSSNLSHYITDNCGDIIFQDNSSDLPGDGSVRRIVIDANNVKWLGTDNGLIRFDGTNWQIFNSSNSGLPSNTILSIKIDSLDNKWIGTFGGGLAKFDNTNWTIYNTGNSYIPSDYVRSIAVENNNQIWVGTDNGLAKFDGSFWSTFNISNSGLPDNEINDIAIDNSNNKWLATGGGGIAKFSGTNWIVYNTSNSSLLTNYSYRINIDSFGNKWIGFSSPGGLGKFDGINWTFFTTSNSLLPTNAYGNPDNVVYAVNFDIYDNLLVGVWGGGFVKVGSNTQPVSEEEFSHLPEFCIEVFPNPSSDKITILIPEKSTIDILNINGQIIKTIQHDCGKTSIDIGDLSNGVYIVRAKTDKEIVTKKFIKQ